MAINEPYWQKNSLGVLALSGHTILYDRKAENVRACILASQNLAINLLTEYTNGDCVAAMLETGIEECKQICIISLYLDIKKDIMSPNLKKLLTKLRQEDIKFTILSDTNSHSSLYGSETSNKRGEIIENEHCL